MSKQILIKNIITGKEFLLAEAGARNILAMHPNKFEKVTSEKPKKIEAPKEENQPDVDIKKTRKRKSSK